MHWSESTYRFLAEAALAVMSAHVAIGCLFAVAFQVRGLTRIDPGARGAGIVLRVMLTPGIVLLWPFLARIWRRSGLGEGGHASEAASSPPSPETLRTWHRYAWLVVLAAGPLILAVALAWRPASDPASPWPPQVQTSP